MNLTRRLAAESLGTFALVLIGTGAIVVDARTNGALGPAGVALAFGLVIMVMVYAMGNISGAHFNLAVTLGFVLARRFSAWRMFPYWCAQFYGAVLGSLVVRELIGSEGGLGVTRLATGAVPGLLLEALLTFVLMFVIMAVTADSRAVGSIAPIAIGGTIALGALFAGPITGASMNPARSLGPALIAGDLTDLWLYLVGPLLGAALGALAYQWVGSTERERGRQSRPRHP